MAKWMWIASAAAIALTAPALAGQDKGKGGGKGGGHEQHGGGGKAERGGGGGAKVERGNSGGKVERQEMRAERGNGGQRMERQADRGNGKAKAERKDDRRAERQADRGGDRAKVDRRAERDVRVERRDDREVRNGSNVLRDERRDDGRRLVGYDNIRSLNGLYDGCPPGLARKNNGCLPPGQAKKLIGATLPAAFGAQMLDGPYRQWYRDNDQFYYRNDDDFIYRMRRDGGLVDALFPFQDANYSYYPVGMNYPQDYDYYNVPYQYQSFYADGQDYNYRYGDGAIYQVNRSDNVISSIVALLAGDMGVGQRMPNTYGVYNVPMAYRDRYYDTPDAMYRYNDGYIYQADPKTQLITAVIDAIV